MVFTPHADWSKIKKHRGGVVHKLAAMEAQIDPARAGNCTTKIITENASVLRQTCFEALRVQAGPFLNHANICWLRTTFMPLTVTQPMLTMVLATLQRHWHETEHFPVLVPSIFILKPRAAS